MRSFSLSLAAAAFVVLACSSASAGWTYTSGVRVVTSTPIVYSYPAYTYPAYTYPAYTYPATRFHPPTVYTPPRVYIPSRAWRRSVWTTW